MNALFPLIITFGLMWVLLIRPQQRRVRQHQSVVASLVVGDEVVTTGGLIGTVEEINEDVLTVSVAPGVSVKMLRSAVQNRIGGADEADLDDLSAHDFDPEEIDPEEIGPEGIDSDEIDEEPELQAIEATAVDELPAGAVGELPPADDSAPTDPLRATGDTPTATGDPAGDQAPPGRSDAGNEV